MNYRQVLFSNIPWAMKLILKKIPQILEFRIQKFSPETYLCKTKKPTFGKRTLCKTKNLLGILFYQQYVRNKNI